MVNAMAPSTALSTPRPSKTEMNAFIGGIGPWEMGVVLVIVLILFGAGRLPQVFASFGKGIKEFRDAQKDPPKDVTPPKELAEGVEEAEVVKSESERVRNG
jgi:sec-independent protein translocase protein TatA